MYAAYALSSIMSPTSSLTDMRAANTIPALIAVLNTSKVSTLQQAPGTDHAQVAVPISQLKSWQ